ncbi:MAG: hypothetical protein ACE5NG_02570, partial [bacterium]
SRSFFSKNRRTILQEIIFHAEVRRRQREEITNLNRAIFFLSFREESSLVHALNREDACGMTGWKKFLHL